ncbi:MAG: hypothetical protein HY231_04505 [Acidobacteria bacterium]|nr:hypothetical protein [Acidobacteriota bacterium]
MMKDTRDVLEVLQAELNFLEQGGYGRSVHTPQVATSMFQDSLSCLNYADPNRPHPCSDCLLIDFVPSARRWENVPCHHIPLNAVGDTVAQLERQDDEQRLEENFKAWLRAKIQELEDARQLPVAQ